jgi:hypothetical protein
MWFDHRSLARLRFCFCWHTSVFASVKSVACDNLLPIKGACSRSEHGLNSVGPGRSGIGRVTAIAYAPEGADVTRGDYRTVEAASAARDASIRHDQAQRPR